MSKAPAKMKKKVTTCYDWEDTVKSTLFIVRIFSVLCHAHKWNAEMCTGQSLLFWATALGSLDVGWLWGHRLICMDRS